MAYSIGKTSALQTAIKAGVDIALAEYAAGALTGPIMDRVQEIANELKGELFAQVDDDNAGSAGGSTYRAPSGGNSRGGAVTVEDAKTMVLNFGWAKGLTIGDVLVMSKDEAAAYSGGKYARTGLDYVKWMSTNKDPKGAFASARAKVALDDFNAQTRDLTKLAG